MNESQCYYKESSQINPLTFNFFENIFGNLFNEISCLLHRFIYIFYNKDEMQHYVLLLYDWFLFFWGFYFYMQVLWVLWETIVFQSHLCCESVEKKTDRMVENRLFQIFFFST